jgi:hypothetical protein
MHGVRLVSTPPRKRRGMATAGESERCEVRELVSKISTLGVQ